MSRLSATVIFIAFFSLIAIAQSKNDRERAGLLGPVQVVQTKSWLYGEPESRPKPDSGDTVTYDIVGNEIGRKMISDFGEDMGTESKVFDASGRLSESKWLDPKGKLLRRIAFAYTGQKLSDIITYDGAGILREKTTKNYDQNGFLIEDIYYDAKIAQAKTVYLNDPAGDPVEIAFFLDNGKKAYAPVGPCLGAHRIAFSYDTMHRPITKAAYEVNGQTKKSWTFTYDARGNYREYVIKSGSDTTRITYTYEFDGRGNWTKSTATDEYEDSIFDEFNKVTKTKLTAADEKALAASKRSTHITTREIKYFP